MVEEEWRQGGHRFNSSLAPAKSALVVEKVQGVV